MEYGRVSKKKSDSKPETAAVSGTAKRQVEFIRNLLKQKVPGANPSDEFLAQVASTYFLSNRNKSVIDAAVKKLMG
tara:strand:- start:174 stop:401 length:228 start_codon:yes stop_codon:yes gene_type:complete